MTGSPRRTVRLPAVAVTLLLAAAALPLPSFATGRNHPEVSDPCGDVDPAASVRPTAGNGTAFENRTAYDVRSLYVLFETSTDLVLEFRACDLPDAWTTNRTVSSQIPLSANASQPLVGLVANFTVRGAQYEVRALLAHPSEGMLREEYRLWRGDANRSLQGAVNATRDTVTVRVPKALVGNPGLGDFLTKFRAEGWFRSTRLDFAPDAVPWTPDPPKDSVSVVLERLDGRTLWEPTYGSNYAFGNHAQSEPKLRLEDADAGRVVRAGESTKYRFVVVNDAPLADQVVLTLSQAPPGFAHQLSATAVTLAAGERRVVELVTSAHASARGDLYSLVTASSALGGSAAHAFITRFYGPDAPPPDPPSGDGGASHDDGEGDGQTTSSSASTTVPSEGVPIFPTSPVMPARRKNTPAPDVGALLGLAGVLAVLLRRR